MLYCALLSHYFKLRHSISKGYLLLYCSLALGRFVEGFVPMVLVFMHRSKAAQTLGLSRESLRQILAIAYGLSYYVCAYQSQIYYVTGEPSRGIYWQLVYIPHS
jgi:hypothetical protein